MSWINTETYEKVTKEMEMWPDWKKKVFNEEFVKSDRIKPLNLTQEDKRKEILCQNEL